MRKFLIVLLFCLFATSPAMSQKTDEPAQKIDFEAMMSEIEEYTRHADRPHPWVSDIIIKYFPLEMDQQIIRHEMKKAGFTMRDFTEKDFNKNKKQEYDTFWRFSKSFKTSWWDVWGHAVGISMDFKNGKLANVRARVVYKHPLY